MNKHKHITRFTLLKSAVRSFSLALSFRSKKTVKLRRSPFIFVPFFLRSWTIVTQRHTIDLLLYVCPLSPSLKPNVCPCTVATEQIPLLLSSSLSPVSYPLLLWLIVRSIHPFRGGQIYASFTVARKHLGSS